MTSAAANPVLLAETIRLATAIADRAALDDLRRWCAQQFGQPWWDTRPLLSPHEHSPGFIDMAAQCLQYATYRQLVQQHPVHPHLIRFLRPE